MKKFLLLLLLILPVSVSGQWKEFTDQFGTQVPYDYNPMVDIQKKAEWFAKARPALEKYSLMVMFELQCRGFVTEKITLSSDDYKASPWGWGFSAMVVRGGLGARFTLQPTTPMQFSPKEFADKFEKYWTELRWNLIESPWLVNDPWYKSETLLKSWKELFLWEPSPSKCEVVFTPGQVCTFDLGSGTVNTKPTP